MKRTALSLFLALGIAGCAQIPLIIQIAGYAVSAMDVAIQAAQTFTDANVTDPATRAKVLNDIAQARAAEAAFQALVNGGAALDSKDVTEALADFEVAWSEVESILKEFGVLTVSPGARAGAGGLAGRLILPSAQDLMPKGADAPAVFSRAAAKMAARPQARRSLDPDDGFAVPASSGSVFRGMSTILAAADRGCYVVPDEPSGMPVCHDNPDGTRVCFPYPGACNQDLAKKKKAAPKKLTERA